MEVDEELVEEEREKPQDAGGAEETQHREQEAEEHVEVFKEPQNLQDAMEFWNGEQKIVEENAGNGGGGETALKTEK
ncbi:hypothetical protein MRX96_044363 [Rhipicephalus microplus]